MDKTKLERLYLNKKLSSKEIGKLYRCSEHKINYWLEKFGIQKRTISEASYQRNNPNGDPFLFKIPKTLDKMFLFGLGLGLFWGEGTKRNLHAVRLCNSSPSLVKQFLHFLIKIYKIDEKKLKFQLQTYDDLDATKLVSFWAKYLSVKKTQFSKTTILQRRGEGTYGSKMKYGVVIAHFNNVKLRNLICSQIANIENM